MALAMSHAAASGRRAVAVAWYYTYNYRSKSTAEHLAIAFRSARRHKPEDRNRHPKKQSVSCRAGHVVCNNCH
jgi:hypothetical protein